MPDGFAMGPFGPIELTDEQRAEIQRQRDLRNMANEEGQRMVREFVDGLDREQLETFKNIVMQGMGDPQDTYLTHMLGWINARLMYQFDVCMACGKKHDEISVLEDPHG